MKKINTKVKLSIPLIIYDTFLIKKKSVLNIKKYIYKILYI